MDTEYTYTPDEFFTKVKMYHKTVENSGDFPDLAGLKNFLDIEDEEYDRMCEDPDYHKAIRWSRRRRESFLNRLATTAKNINGIKILLAQPENGGYVEKPVDKTPRKVVVTLRGMPDDDDMDSDLDDPDSDDSEFASAEQEVGKQDRQSGNMPRKAVRNSRRTKGK